ncbi:hypothetical protein KGY64_07910 [Candidatus Bipolaricaulota bacterium]|nr:hypothetical protein [Candidatus Bipolaricaulota bacterium]
MECYLVDNGCKSGYGNEKENKVLRSTRATSLTAMCLLAMLLIFIFPPRAASAEREVVVYFFWASGCHHCEQQKPLMEDLENSYDRLRVEDRNIVDSSEHQKLLFEMGEAFGQEVRGVPATFIGNRVWVGFTEEIGGEIQEEVDVCLAEGCIDPLQRLEEPDLDPSRDTGGRETLVVPFLGPVDLTSLPTFGATSLIAFVDGFNPCSLWVLTFLLGVLVHTRSRKKILLVGLTFLTITATTYGLFILGLFSAFQYIGQLFWIRLTVALLAFIMGIVSIKDFFWFKRGISFTIPEGFKPKLGKRIRGLMNGKGSAPALIAATAVIALGVTLVELPCTAGFPVIWTGIMSASGVGPATFGVLFATYILIYLLIELVIFGTATVTLSSSRLQEKHGKWLKLVGGSLMVVLGGTFLFAPELLYEASGIGVVLGASLVTTLVLIVLRNSVLPRLANQVDKRG